MRNGNCWDIVSKTNFYFSKFAFTEEVVSCYTFPAFFTCAAQLDNHGLRASK